MKVLVNGNGPITYLKCVDPHCDKLPTNLYQAVDKNKTRISLLFCDDHEGFAAQIVEISFNDLFFIGSINSKWLKKHQEKELRRLNGEGFIFSFLRRKEG